MNIPYKNFGQGLCMRGNTRPTIATAGFFGQRTSGAWGADWNESDLSQRHFLMKKSMARPTIDTRVGLSTEQRAYLSQINPDTTRLNYTGMTGTAGFYDKFKPKYCVVKNIPNIQSFGSKLMRDMTNGFYKKKRSSRNKRRTGGSYADVRNAINKASTSGFYKKKKKSSKRTTRRKH